MAAENINFVIAFLAGVVSFISPCVLPLVPSYISFIGGQGLQELRSGGRGRLGLMLKTLFFVLGFSLVFVLMGMFFWGTARAIGGGDRWINIVAGSVVLVFGLNLIFNFIRFLNYEKRYHFSSRPAGILGSLLLGMAFAAGWSPCIGPILGSIIALAASSSGAAGSGLLLAAYSLGLALPFLLTSAFLSRAEKIMKRIKPHMLLIQRVSGGMLVALGLLLIFGRYKQITNWLALSGFRLQAWQAAHELLSRVLFSAAFILVGLAILLPALLPLLTRRRTESTPDTATDAQGNPEAVVSGKGAGISAETVQPGGGSSATTPRLRLGVWRLIFVLIFLVPGLLQAFGLIDIPVLLGSWLSFQGI